MESKRKRRIISLVALAVVVSLFLVQSQWRTVLLQLIPFPKNQYEVTLQKILENHRAVGYGEYAHSSDVVLLIHDVDERVQGLDALCEVERKLDVRSILFVRPFADYYEDSKPLLRGLCREGFEVGYHYEVERFEEGLDLLRGYFNVSASHAHGGASGVDASVLSGNHTHWNELGLQDISWLEYDTWVEDTHREWKEPEDLGSKVIFLTHSDYW